MNWQNVLRIAKKEWSGFFNNPLGYTVVVPFLFISIFIFTRTALVGGEASLRPYFELLPWFLVLLAPAISMKLLTDEFQSETMEVLFAHPISEIDIVVGKFLGAFFFFLSILGMTLLLPITMLVYSRPDIGQIAGQYIGAAFIGATFLSIGLAASAYIKNTIGSFLTGAAISFLLLIIGLDFVAQMLPYPFNLIAAELSVVTHGDNIARGLLDIRDVFYFLTITSVCLAAAVAKLSERRTVEQPKELRKLQLAFMLIVGIGFVANIFLSYYPMRLDLTQARLFTLTRGTRDTIKNLPDLVTVTVYESKALPAQMQLVARDINDLLADYQKLGRNFRYKILYPETSPDAATEARSAGIQEVQFNSIGLGKFEVQSGMLGVAIRYGDKTEALPFVSDSSDLEYQLTRRIRKVTSDKAATVGLLDTGFAQRQALDGLLATQYQVKKLSDSDLKSTPDFTALMIVDDGSSEGSASAAILNNYLNAGGSALVFVNGVSVSQQTLTAAKSSSPLLPVLKDYGISVNNDLVYDLQLSEILSFNSAGGQRYLAQYPYWIRTLPADPNFSPLSTVKSIAMGWASSLTLDNKEGVTLKPLLTTGTHAGKTESNFNVSPQAVGSLQQNASKVPVAVFAQKGNTRLIVVDATSVVDDQFMNNNRDNVAFVSNAIDFLATDKDVAAIPSKSQGRPVFEFRSPVDLFIVQYGNLLVPPVLLTLFAIFYLRKRRLLTRRTYVR